MVVVKEPDSGNSPLEHHRTQGRLNSRVPIALEWTEGSQQFRTDGYTIDVSPRGCLTLVTMEFTARQHLRLINLANQNSCEVVLVWSRKTERYGWELGLELQEPGFDFWGLEL